VPVPRPLLILSAALLLAACTRSGEERTTAIRSMDEPMPVLAGEGVQGGSISTRDYLGSVLVVNVWANWCTPCQQEQPDLVRVAHQYASRGVRFLGIDHMDQDAAAVEWIRTYHVPYPSIADPSGRFAASLGYVGLPDTYVVDAAGTIRYAIGPGATSAAQLSRVIDQVLAAQTSASSATATNSPAR
jgi:thiol-disulfide isomerase/thioredoxin